jgi:hypothetical protein
MSKLSTKEIYLIGGVGIPYYIFILVLAAMLEDIYSYGFLILLPLLFIYDRLSQPSYIYYVKNGSCSKVKYSLVSMLYQFLFICIVTIIIGAIET